MVVAYPCKKLSKNWVKPETKYPRISSLAHYFLLLLALYSRYFLASSPKEDARTGFKIHKHSFYSASKLRKPKKTSSFLGYSRLYTGLSWGKNIPLLSLYTTFLNTSGREIFKTVKKMKNHSPTSFFPFSLPFALLPRSLFFLKYPPAKPGGFAQTGETLEY